MTEHSEQQSSPRRDHGGQRPHRHNNHGGRSHPNRGRGHHGQRSVRGPRKDRPREPQIDGDVTGRELDGAVTRELAALEEHNRVKVAKHLVMAARYLEADPELAFDHARAASSRGGRIGVVREAVGITAYEAEKYQDALREFRTYRRISGDDTHIPEIVDCERALGRGEKALQTAAEVNREKLTKRVRVELAIVVSGILQDLGRAQEAVAALQIPELDRHKAFSYSPRLFTAYADALENAGQEREARLWRQRTARAESALGFSVTDDDPAIIDLGEDFEPAPDKSPRTQKKHSGQGNLRR
ncbi:hypothetical protein [Auritidibacter ignavus]|uniref:hypothetical protein n=1 Tax=Auritidibacter ignavus TaxID=678932 RepID=UPI0024B96506|nr:hypothetical protein [Auritidibacter ignavus]WHS27692.1 hypothetical protein QM395_10010 [Auritidibacter ignavus]